MPVLSADALIGIVGAGAMGAGIAQVAAQAGHPVRLVDARAGAAGAAIEQIRQRLDAAVAKGRLAADRAGATLSRLRAASGLHDLAPAALVVEAIVEELGAKRSLLAELEHVVGEDSVLASNTSSLSVTAMGSALRAPGRFAGMHFFNPAPVMELVEIVSGLATAPETIETLTATAAAWGKLPVRCRSSPGFIVNRVARPFYLESLRMLQEGVADAATLDAIARESGGFRMGPFELMDLIGNDVSLAVTRSLFEATGFDPRYRPSLRQRELVEAGWLGRKSGRGWYRHGGDAPPPTARSLGPAAPPSDIRVSGGDAGLLRPLLDRLHASGLAISSASVDGPPGLRFDGAQAVALGGGPEADAVLDLCLDYRSCTRLAVAASGPIPPPVVGGLQAGGIAVSPVPLRPGLVLGRLLATLLNEAVDLVDQGMTTPDELDLAMRKGVNYPRGPLEWAATLPPTLLPGILDGLWSDSRDPRYGRAVGLRD